MTSQETTDPYEGMRARQILEARECGARARGLGRERRVDDRVHATTSAEFASAAVVASTALAAIAYDHRGSVPMRDAHRREGWTEASAGFAALSRAAKQACSCTN